jgi:hypothetical protein
LGAASLVRTIQKSLVGSGRLLGQENVTKRPEVGPVPQSPPVAVVVSWDAS